MTLRNIGFDSIDKFSLQRLIDDGTAESRNIEYKATTYGGNDDARAEFLADVSSLANTVGGDLILGISASDGTPTAFSPLKIAAEQECLRLQNMALSGLEPRIPNLQIKSVPLSPDDFAIVIRIPRSYNPPHRVVFKGKNRFWARSSAGKYEPDVEELRALFVLAPQLADKMREFRESRIAKIAAGEAPVTLTGKCCLALHVIPLSAFDIGSGTALSISDIHQNYNYFPPMFGSTNNWRVNFDGLLTLSSPDLSATQQRAYVQVFRSGIIESVAVVGQINQGDSTKSIIEALSVEMGIIASSRKYAESLAASGLATPFVLVVRLLGTKGHQLVYTRYGFPKTAVPNLDRDQLHFSEVILDTIPANDLTFAPMVRSVLDQLANAAGFAQTASFNSEGVYVVDK
ncbi:helix-turn-helix domain-containing protein [Collimonas sp. OK412]|uniref:AlbA family DNA-binding domain-containing protein n=1 Tax=Collimonas sp. (strain OK412) TaxID=1801619 RepID=UPI0008F34BF0|nr:ATP-binding protein [Collimonas sp. OK412]SFD03017.1 Putative DNA-binding domain-containing protein [Collimonas sp. OK412]